VKAFTARAAPGAYLRVLVPGRVSTGDPVTVVHRPDHEVSIGLTFRALTAEPALLPQLLDSPDLTPETERRARRHEPIRLDD
jgi:MOSC domain-containing protein YiiM